MREKTSYVVDDKWPYTLIRMHRSVSGMRSQLQKDVAYSIPKKDVSFATFIAAEVTAGSETYYKITEVKIDNAVTFKGTAFMPTKYQGHSTLKKHLERVKQLKHGALGNLN